MVHRAPDSRLLTNLLASEKEYAKHLAALSPLSHAALASLSAYAAASPSQPSSPAQSIAAVVDVLASAEDALQRYNRAVEAWREQLVSLKDLEDDLSAVLRDRDILVTRLIRASKSTRDAHRSSRLINPLTGLGSASFSSLPSSSSATTGSGTGPANTNSKLAQAQAELQACEAHLVAKERDLDARRISVAREGLGARCRALIDCGWVWNEMGKQGLRTLQALGANSVASSGPVAIPPHLNAVTCASDNSSLTPSQSASQTVPRCVETSHEGLTSKEHERTTEFETTSKTSATQARTTHTEDDELTITLPPAHAISELAYPTGVRSQPPQNGDSTARKQTTSNTISAPAPAPERKRTKRPRRPPSQHINEVSDEGFDELPSASDRNTSGNVNPDPLAPRTTFPVTHAALEKHDTSSEDDPPIGSLEVVDNDPFEVIRKSMLGPPASAASLPTAPSAPTAHASVSDVRGGETSPSKAAFPSSASGPGLTPSPGAVKRERRTSVAFFGSLRDLFRKPKDRGKVATEWDEGHSSPSPSSPTRTTAKASGKGGGGWVTRTDARIKGSRGGEGDSDDEATPTQSRTGTGTGTTPVANMAQRGSGGRLRKGRPGASTRGIHENGSSSNIPVVPSRPTGVGVDGWTTDNPTAANTSTGWGTGVGQGRSRTRRKTIKQKKTSAAFLRGNDQRHTDGEVDSRGVDEHHSLERVDGKGPEMSTSGSKPAVDLEEERELSRRGSTSKGVSADPNPIADPNLHTNASPGTQHRRAATTAATSSRKLSSDGTLTHRRSASLSLVHPQGAHTLMSTGGAMSWRKPPPQVELLPRPETPSRSQTPSQTPPQTQTESQPKPSTRRHLNNGHAPHVHKHAQNQSLMSIVADVTRQNENEGAGRVWSDKTRSLDLPRAPGSVLHEVDRDREPPGTERETGVWVHGREHARALSSPTGMDGSGRGRSREQAGHGGQRPVKLPLRSALRNASRTPSPSPASALVPAPVTLPVVVPARNDQNEGMVRVDAESSQVEGDRGRKVASVSPRDSASISSYETGRESFYVEEGEGASAPRSQSHSPAPRSQSPTSRTDTPPLPPLSFTFPPPPVAPPPASVSAPVRDSNPNLNSSEPPSSNVSTETPPARRKSVRVSLQPTFSPTPPALLDDDGDGYAPWSKSFSTRDDAEGEGETGGKRGGKARERDGRKTKKGPKGIGDGDAQEDMWADSSSEDEAYSRARRLLSLAGKHDKAKGKARAKT